MGIASIATINSTIVRSKKAAPALLRAYFGIASRVLPGVARRQAERLFTRPPRYAGRGVQPPAARHAAVALGRRRLATWRVGDDAAPAVLLVHGWGGRGVQMSSFVEPLVARGFRVVWFDQPAHGDSGRGTVGLPDFARAIEAVAAAHGPFVAAIGHSLGGAALGLALRRGLALGRVVLVSVPSSMIEHTRAFARLLGIAAPVREAMRHRLEQRYGMPFDDIDRIDDLARLALPALFVHDRGDPEVAFRHGQRLARHMRNTRFITTYGFGHYRILREPSVVAAIADFVAGDDDVPGELPRLPRPAPLC
jgi:pimeloyl-ACP methyl ester carboxylesterase